MSSCAISLPLLLAQANQPSRAAFLMFVFYTALVMALAWFSSRLLARRRFLNEYFLGSRSLGVIAFTLTFGATSASAGSFAGFPSLIYTHGWVLAFWISSYMIMPLCAMGLLGKRLNQISRKTGAITVPEVMRERFQSPMIGIVATLMMAAMLCVYLIPQFKLAGIILQTLLADLKLLQDTATLLAPLKQNSALLAEVDLEYLVCLIVFAFMVVIYTTVGGFRAVVWTDVLQGFVMLFGVIVMLVLALWQVGGLRNATEKLANQTTPALTTVVFETATPAEEAQRVPADTWFMQFGLDPTGHYEHPHLYRTNELAVILPGETASNAVKTVEIRDADEIAKRSREMDFGPPAGMGSVTIAEEKPYASGGTGSYVTGPGPSPKLESGFLPLGLAVSFFVFWAISATGQPGNMVRLMAFDSARTLKRGIAALSIYFGMIYFPLVIIFVCARIIAPGLDQTPDRIMPVMAVSLSGAAGIPWLAGLLVAAPFAAAMSTVDSFMLMISSSVVRDVYQRNINPEASGRRIKLLSYACTIIVGTLVTLAAVNPPKFMQYLIIFTGGGLSVTFLMPMALALYWPRANKSGMLAAMLGGFSVYLSLYLTGYVVYRAAQPVMLLSLDPLIWGFAASLVAGVLVSLATAPPPEHLVRKFFYAP